LKKSAFWGAGHRPTLIAAFLYFDRRLHGVGPAGSAGPGEISKTLGPDAGGERSDGRCTDPGLARCCGSARGFSSIRIGPKRTGAISQVIVIVGLVQCLFFGVTTYAGTLALGVILGFARCELRGRAAVASRWYPPEHQGQGDGHCRHGQ
jgi:NNP family nitrate/nitrite transporter-like MFS transporter